MQDSTHSKTSDPLTQAKLDVRQHYFDFLDEVVVIENELRSLKNSSPESHVGK